MIVLRGVLPALMALLAVVVLAVVWFARDTRTTIERFELAVASAAEAADPLEVVTTSLPTPVEHYFAYVFPNGPSRNVAYVELEMAGQFRRPQTESFAPTTARQVASVRTPDFTFSADTTVLGPVWAIAYDAYLDGQMEMRAKVLSAITVMDQVRTPSLDQASLRRWLLESPTYPMALLPGGPVRWEPIDDTSARAIVRAHGTEASLVATFDKGGALLRFDAEEDGDLTTPYHGSGEHVTRTDYQLVDGVRVPMGFEIARAAGGERFPFWVGRVTSISFHAAAPTP